MNEWRIADYRWQVDDWTEHAPIGRSYKVTGKSYDVLQGKKEEKFQKPLVVSVSCTFSTFKPPHCQPPLPLFTANFLFKKV